MEMSKTNDLLFYAIRSSVCLQAGLLFLLHIHSISSNFDKGFVTAMIKIYNYVHA